ncbi:MAG: hypothetical protein KAJ03_01625 [Gammaproteobacteria bacterium]|nr:hypothetical protein [Gammaproteobacteria bacterium]
MPTFPLSFPIKWYGNPCKSFAARVVVQNDTAAKNIYYPNLINASTNSHFGWAADTATIEIGTNASGSTAAFTSALREGDIIRLQTNPRILSGEANVWLDVFEGRISKIESDFNIGGNNTKLVCRGHDEEFLKALVTADKSYSSQRTGFILKDLMTTYLAKITDASPSLIDTTTSTVVTSYNIKKHGKYFVDPVKDMEDLEAFGYRISVVPTYASDGTLSAVYLSYQPVQSTASTLLQIIEGTTRLISANFYDSGVERVNHVVVYGQQGAPQKIGEVNDVPNQTSTGKIMSRVVTDTTLTTDALCTSLAQAALDEWLTGTTGGSVQISFSPYITPGMLVYVRIPSLEINGVTIDGNYRVRKVSHRMSVGGATTTLQLGDPVKSNADVIASFHKSNRVNNSNSLS